MSKTLSENTFSKGLEDVIAGESSVCQIDGHNSKLFYRGYDIHTLAENSNFEETIYLLLKGQMPNKAQLEDLNSQLSQHRVLPVEVLECLKALPINLHPMAVLRSAVSLLGHFDPEAEDKSAEANFRKAIRLIAKTPLLVANIDLIRKKKNPVIKPSNANGSTAEIFLTALKSAAPTAVEAKMLDKYFILLAEHDLNASTFAAMIAASTTSDIYSAVVSAIGTLKGDLHGSANSRAMESILEVGEPSRVETYVDEALAKKKKLMGFGHRVYKGPDPRAFDLHNMSKELAANNAQQAKWYAISERMEKYVWEKKKLNCNVDFYSASVLYTVGIPVDLFTPMFAISRMAGWTAHVLEQYSNNRLIRPVSIYTGPQDQSYTPINSRS